MTAPLDLAALEAVARGATPGPWHHCSASDGRCQCGLVWSLPVDNVVCTVKPGNMSEPGLNRDEDAHFIAAFSPDVALALLAEVAALRGEAERMRVSDLQIARYADGQRALAEQAELRLEHACRQRDAAIAERDAAVALAREWERLHGTADTLRRQWGAERDAARADVERLTTRRDELLAAMAKLSRELPYPEEVAGTNVLIAEVGTLRSALAAAETARDEMAKVVERMRRDARFTDAECNESSWLRESELDRLAETGAASRRVLVDNRELAMLVAEARDHRLLRTQHERMRPVYEAAKAWKAADSYEDGTATRSLVAAIDALDADALAKEKL